MIKRLKNVIKVQLEQGVAPEKLAQSLSVGLLVGCFPLLGFTTGLAAVFGVIFKLNHFVVQAANYVMYPIQLLLIPVYIKTVSYVIEIGDVPIMPDEILKMFNDDWRQFLKLYGLVGLYSIVLWIVISVLLYVILQKLLLSSINKLKALKR